jgi:CheY-like chemotaxis protein
MATERKRILIAEDNGCLRAVLCSTLSDSYEVAAVPDGAAMEEELRRSSFDLVITDLNLPKLAGTVVLAGRDRASAGRQEIKGLGVRAIVITGMDPEDEEFRRARLMPNVLNVFQKPLDLEALRRYVDWVLCEVHVKSTAAFESSRILAASSASVLLVDDDHEMHREVSTLLDKAGYLVRSCAEPAAVLDLCRAHRFDLLLISFVLECGTATDLIENLHRSLSAQALPPMVILNGLGEALTLDYFRNYPQVKAIVHKPIQGSDLLCAVQGLLGCEARTGATSSHVVS